MASSDPPYDAGDEPTTQPLRRPEATPSSDVRETSAAGADDAGAAQPSRDGGAAGGQKAAGGDLGRVMRQNTNWFEPGFGAEPAPQVSVGPEPQIPPPVVLHAGAPEAAPESAHIDGHPAEPAVEPRAMDAIAAEIGDALHAS